MSNPPEDQAGGQLNRRTFLARSAATLAAGAGLPFLAGSSMGVLGGCTARRSEADLAKKLVIGIWSDVRTLDPAMCNMALDGAIVCNIHEPLTWFGLDLKLAPKLALSWEAENDARAWVFKLRPNVTFHDGTPFNAEAVKFHFDRIRFPETKSNRLTKIAKLDHSEVIDDLTIRFHMKGPFAVWPILIRDAFASIVSPTRAREAPVPEQYKWHPVGTGPYEFVEYRPDQFIRLRKNHRHWDAANYHVEELEFRPVREPTTRLILLEQGELDIADLSYAHAEVIEKAGHVHVDRVPALRISYIGLNYQKPPLNDPRVRRALNYAINREDIIKYAFRGTYDASYGPLPHSLPAYNANTTKYMYDPTRAKQLLADAGHAKGLRLTLWSMDRAADRAMAETLHEQMRMVGVDLNIVMYDQAVYWDKFDAFLTDKGEKFPTRDGVFDMFLAGWTGGESAYGFLDPLFRSTSSSNSSFYENKEVDRLLDEALNTADEAARDEIYKRVQEIIVDDAPWVFAYFTRLLIGHGKRITGWKVHPAGEYEIAGVNFLPGTGRA